MTYTKIHDKLKQRKGDKGKLERVERNRKYIFMVKLQYVKIQSQSVFVNTMLILHLFCTVHLVIKFNTFIQLGEKMYFNINRFSELDETLALAG